MRQLPVLLSLLFLLACGESDRNFRPETTVEGYAGIDTSEEIVYDEMEVDAVSLSPPPTAAPSQETIAQKIIKNGRLRFETQDLAKTRQRLMGIVQQYEGYVQNDNSGKNYNQTYQNFTIRIPTRNFEATLQAIEQGVKHFDEKTISQQDVTEEFVDLNARLKAKRVLEDRYLELLAKAKNVKEMLEIERELANIREEIEAKEGRLRYLSNQVSLSTLHINIYKTEVETVVSNSYGSKMLNALKSGWNGISVFFLGLLHLWPFLILLGLGILFLRRWIRKNKRA